MRFLPFLYAVLFGSVTAYLISSITFYKLNNIEFLEISRKDFKTSPVNDINLSLILERNIFDARIEKSINQQKVKHSVKNQNKVSGIKDYKLVGFVIGKYSMALFKKSNEPVVIVDRNTPLQKNWYLKEIKDGVVYLYNKNTMEIQKFEIEKKNNKNILLNNNIEKFKISKTFGGKKHIEQ